MDNSKTPVMILNELMVQRGQTVEYNLILDQTGRHDPTFQYQVNANKYVAYGTGRSKKEAKHNAAKAFLEVLNKSPIHKQVEAGPSFKSNHEEPSSTMNSDSPNYDTTDSPGSNRDFQFNQVRVIAQNYVGALKDFCYRYSLEANYEILTEVGPPHSKHFTMRCNVQSIKETVTCTTKKAAKQLCAQRMLQRLTDTILDPRGFNDETQIVSPDYFLNDDEKYLEIQNEIKKRAPNKQRVVIENYKAFIEFDRGVRETLLFLIDCFLFKKYNIEKDENSELANKLGLLSDEHNLNNYEFVKKLLTLMNVDHKTIHFPPESNANLNFGISLKIFSEVPIGFMAFDKDQNLALENVSMQCIKFFKLTLDDFEHSLKLNFSDLI